MPARANLHKTSSPCNSSSPGLRAVAFVMVGGWYETRKSNARPRSTITIADHLSCFQAGALVPNLSNSLDAICALMHRLRRSDRRKSPHLHQKGLRVLENRPRFPGKGRGRNLLPHLVQHLLPFPQGGRFHSAFFKDGEIRTDVDDGQRFAANTLRYNAKLRELVGKYQPECGVIFVV